jgi:hypothetical protein
MIKMSHTSAVPLAGIERYREVFQFRGTNTRFKATYIGSHAWKQYAMVLQEATTNERSSQNRNQTTFSDMRRKERTLAIISGQFIRPR